ncbi:MAG: pilus assembly protein PilN [Gammaproteobacteria bacterium]|nr:pilus assembly protein PilN [Gammaproteobacteria bacterium]
MARINLLPWREEARSKKTQEFGVLIGAFAVVAGIIVLIIHVYNSQLIDAQMARNKYMEDEIAKLDIRIQEIQNLEAEKRRLLDRMRAIEQLQTNRPLIVRFFDELINSLPEGVSINNIIQQQNNVTINGVAQSNARVSSLMRNLDESEWLANPALDIIQATSGAGTRISQFTLRFNQVIPKLEGEEE